VEAVSVRSRRFSVSARSRVCSGELGRGGAASASPCRAGACEGRGQTGSWRTDAW
jgi:hypothetical protein